MKDHFVTYEIALKLKEKGFDELCFAEYNSNDKYNEPWVYGSEGNVTEQYSNRAMIAHDAAAPLWQQVVDWLREDKNIHVLFEYGLLKKYFVVLFHSIEEYLGDDKGDIIEFSTFHEARKKGIEKALELI